MTQREFESEMGKARGMEYADLERACFWIGYALGLRRGYFGDKSGTDEEHMKWWAMAEEDNSDHQKGDHGYRAGFRYAKPNREEGGQGYRAGFRCAKLGRGYCSRPQNSFYCETCSVVSDGRDCHNNPILDK